MIYGYPSTILLPHSARYSLIDQEIMVSISFLKQTFRAIIMHFSFPYSHTLPKYTTFYHLICHVKPLKDISTTIMVSNLEIDVPTNPTLIMVSSIDTSAPIHPT